MIMKCSKYGAYEDDYSYTNKIKVLIGDEINKNKFQGRLIVECCFVPIEQKFQHILCK